MSTDAEALVDDYLARLDRAAGALPDDRRTDVVAGIREHIDAARESGVAHDEASLRDLLDRLGEPDEIVAAAREGDDPLPPPPPPAVAYARPGIGTEVTAALLLTAGSFVPFVGWIAGVIVAWTSRRWTTGEKLLATLVMPFGPAAGLVVMAYGSLMVTQVCSTSSSELADGTFTSEPEVCTGPPVGTGWLVLLLVAVWIVAPFVVAIMLVRRARARADLEPAVAVPLGPTGPGSGASRWGGLEIAAVLLLAVGAFVVPVVGPVIGLLCAWMSDQWTRTEKWVATAIASLSLLVPLVVVLIFVALRTA